MTGATMSVKKRMLLVGGAGLVLAAVGIGYTVAAATRSPASAYAAGEATPETDAGLYIRSSDGSVVVQDEWDAAGEGTPPRTGTGLGCFRFYAAGDAAVCLNPKSAFQPFTTAEILDSELQVTQTLEFRGVPSRARVSPSGRMIAWTVFVTGDDYAGTDFSTRTGLLDTETGYLVDSMETLQLYIDGKRHRASDVNYWGVTFADDNRFYATVATGGKTYLIEGDVEAWTAKTLHENVECPSLSPDGTRVAFKKRVSEGVDDPWRLYVLDLATMEETALAEDRNVDDQAAWLDDGTVAYAVGEDVYSVPADGSGESVLIAPDAATPVLVAP
ncbi:TolB family protein [Microbacterium sp. PMB16]|uniref:TolB family protein n=1 Tax=Microbacterium sp. PMB16 TaxID=3120157 RepID=UPI003F4C1C5A